MIITHPQLADASAHAIREYPKEACGMVVAGTYKPVPNTAEDPLTTFRMDPAISTSHFASGRVTAVIHSHPPDVKEDRTWPRDTPSAADMTGQIQTGVPWGILVMDKGPIVREYFEFGDQCPVPQLLGRPWRHGVTDCFALVRDGYRLGKPAFADICTTWPYDPIKLPNKPRDDEWWYAKDETGAPVNLIEETLPIFGFEKRSNGDIQPGDTLLFKIAASVVNHCALYLGDGLMLHHLYGTLSRRNPVARYMNMLCHVMRPPHA